MQPSDSTGPFDAASALEAIARRHRQAPPPRGRKPFWGRAGMPAAAGVALLSAATVLYWISRRPAAPQLVAFPAQTVAELELLELDASAGLDGGGPWRFALEDAPDGAVIDPHSGLFSWRPSEAQGPGWYDMTVMLFREGDRAPAARQPLAVAVTEVNRPPQLEPIEDFSVEAGGAVSFAAAASDPDLPAERLVYRLGADPPDGAEIDARSGQFRFTPPAAEPGGEHRVTIVVQEAVPRGLTAERSFVIRVTGAAMPEVAQPREPAAPSEPDMPKPPVATAQAAPAETADAAPENAEEDFDAAILDLHRKHRLFRINEYPALRRVYAARFERQHAEDIRRAFGAEAETMNLWLDEHPEIKEELFTAIRPEHDNVAAVLALFHDLHKQFADELDSYPDLAIAVAVTWDDPQAVYDHAGHARRTRSSLPEGALGAVESFRYFLQAERYMEGRAHFLPWEFLVHLVNHKTPLDERGWAVRNYLPKRAMIGKCYHDVPYDSEMLASGGQVTRLEGHPYTLENLAKYGGVCSMQADFAARVAKSLGVPAESVGGESRFGEGHAWVMWIELKGVSKTSIGFSLESYGRYRGDKYYVGHLRAPQTGEKITDRQLELRLHTAGMNPQANRHAQRIMAAYPMIRDADAMDVAEQILFLNRVLELCPGNEEAWRALAAMSRDGVVGREHSKAMMLALEALFRTFAALPDFTWEVFDDLVAFQDDRQQRARLYGRLVYLYEQAERPDLACEARLKYTEYLLADKQYAQAVEGLAAAVKRFPDEGRYVPRMLDKLEEICGQTDGAGEQLSRFWRDFLPLIPQKRGDRPSPYCIEMYQRGIDRFRQGGQEALARLYEAQLASLQASQPAKP